MARKIGAQATVGVSAEALWRAITKDLSSVLQDAAPNLLKHAEILEGDGGLGTVFKFCFGKDATHMPYQKEKIVELDETNMQFGVEVIEGGQLDQGLIWYVISFKLTSLGDEETLVDVKVTYESEDDDEYTVLPEKTLNNSLLIVHCLASYLQRVSH